MEWRRSGNKEYVAYIGTIGPHLDYGSTCSSASNTLNYTLENVQNQALRLLIESMRSTPIKIKEVPTVIQPLRTRIQDEMDQC